VLRQVGMAADIKVFWGEPPAERSEAEFLAQLKEDLARRGIPAVILANYFTVSSSRQVDFFVITETHACHVELKRYPPFLIGGTNGPWSSRRPDGMLEEIDRQNPYTQASACKMAISDDMRAVARKDSSVPQPAPGREFYRQIDSVICIFPRLDHQSQVPDDYRVRTMGYTQFVGFLAASGSHPGWNAGHWAALVRMLGLADAGKPPSLKPDRTAAQDRVSGYLRSLRDFYSRELHELVPLPLITDEGSLPASGLYDALQQHRHVQLAGPSGTGKTHLARHLLATIPDGALVPVLVEGTMYEGRLSPLLDRAVAAFTTASPRDLQLAAAIGGQAILLVVDGFNECPPALQERLLRDLSSLCRRSQAVTLITSQAAATMPENLSGAVIRTGTLTAEDRKAILGSYGAPEIAPMCEPFTTVYELAIAAECASELLGTVTRASLFSAFTRRRLRTGAHPAHTRGALRQLALAMDAELATSLPIDQAERAIEQYLADHSATRDILDEVLASSITTSRHGRVAFSHELLGRFLAAEGLLLGNRDLPGLVEALWL
jgi:Nuclease-related domain/AAA domain (dynein-related subfamily)